MIIVTLLSFLFPIFLDVLSFFQLLARPLLLPLLLFLQSFLCMIIEMLMAVSKRGFLVPS